jgi:hypothetical protein
VSPVARRRDTRRADRRCDPARPGTSWTKVAETTPGAVRDKRKAVRDGLLARGVIVNVTKSGAVLDYCEQGHPARLYPADDPTISHLRLTFAGSQAKPAPDQGDKGVNFDLRRFARL